MKSKWLLILSIIIFIHAYYSFIGAYTFMELGVTDCTCIGSRRFLIVVECHWAWLRRLARRGMRVRQRKQMIAQHTCVMSLWDAVTRARPLYIHIKFYSKCYFIVYWWQTLSYTCVTIFDYITKSSSVFVPLKKWLRSKDSVKSIYKLSWQQSITCPMAS